MKILVLGGGQEGKAIAKRLAIQDDVSQVIIGDRSESRAEGTAAEIGKKASVEVVDAHDIQKVVELIKKVDFVANCVGPFYRFEAIVLEAAIEAKTNYGDICDDADATLKMLELDEPAKKAGITALVGMGSAPGLSNMMCKYAADKLDRTDKIHIYWTVHLGSSGGGVGAGLHGWHMFDRDVPQFLDGKLVMVPGGAGAEMVEFSDGRAECYYLGHPEQITLPRYIKGVKEVTNKGVMLPEWATQDQLKLIEMGFGSDEPIKIKKDILMTPIEVGLTMHSRYLQGKDLGTPWSGEKWEVIGEKDGKTVTYSYQFRKGSKFMSSDAGMEVVTCVPATIGFLMVARGQGEAKGVVPPEGCLSGKAFVSKFIEEAGEAFIETVTISGDIEI